jgi:hydrogenase maturation protease
VTGPKGGVLVAGIGNIFQSDDGFGVEVIRRLAWHPERFPAGVELVDVGIRGMHLAYQLLDGYAGLVMVDATARGGRPGELYLLEHDLSARPEPGGPDVPVPDAHDMTPDTVLSLLGSLAVASGQQPTAGLRRVLVVGCEPTTVEDGMGLSEPVEAAVDRAATAVIRVVTDLLDDTDLRNPSPTSTTEEISS